MSRGKYSPNCPHSNSEYDFKYNCFKKLPDAWNSEVTASGVGLNLKTMFPNYDEEGFDSYGYSAFDAEGNYAGIGLGVDRLGYTEDEYLCMSEEDFAYISSKV